jgi:hypothetical protein
MSKSVIVVLYLSMCLAVGWLIGGRIKRWVLSRLPDDCEVEGCDGRGVRGNTNITKGIIMCDDCHAKAMSGHPIQLKRKDNGTRN